MPALDVGTLLLSMSPSLPPWGNLEILVIRSSVRISHVPDTVHSATLYRGEVGALGISYPWMEKLRHREARRSVLQMVLVELGFEVCNGSSRPPTPLQTTVLAPASRR